MKNKISMIGNKLNIVSKFLFIYFSILFCNAGNSSNKVNFKISKQDKRNMEMNSIRANRYMHRHSIYTNTAHARGEGYNFSYAPGKNILIKNNIKCTVYDLIKFKNEDVKQDNIEMISGSEDTYEKIKNVMKKNDEMSRGKDGIKNVKSEEMSSEIVGIKNVKSGNILKEICGFVFLPRLLNIIKYNKELRKALEVTLDDYKGLTIIAVFDVEDNEKVEYIIKNKTDYIKNSIYKVECKEDDETKKITVVARYSVNEFVKIYKKLENDNLFKKNCGDKEEDIDSLDGKNRKVFITLFSNAKSLKLIGLNIFGEKLSNLFSSFTKLEELDLSSFNTSNVTNMSFMFSKCSSLKELNLNNFNTNNVTKMSGMFSGCSSLERLNLNNFNTNNVTSMRKMFYGCSSLNELNLSNFNTNNVTDMSYVFNGCSSLNKLDLSNWNTDNVTDMDCMFSGCSSLKELNVSSFNTDNVFGMEGMFSECSSLKELNLSNFNNNKVTDMNWMFSGCSSLKELNLSNFNTNNVTKMYSMFSKCSSLERLNLNNFNTNNVTDMSFMFSECSSLKELNLSNFYTNNVTDMSYMFYKCLSLASLDLSTFDTSNVTDMQYMFKNCSSLTSLSLPDKVIYDNVTNSYKNMFEGCDKLKGNVTTNDERIKSDYGQFIKKANK